MSGTLGDTALRDLREHVHGRVLAPGDTGYDDARTLFNAMIDARPAVIAQCADAEDVRTALRFARENDLETAVRAGGHSVAGMSTVEEGLVIDVRNLKGAQVDPAARRVRCGAGLTWGEFDAATQEHGLATTGGRGSPTRGARLTPGGGPGRAGGQPRPTGDNPPPGQLGAPHGRVIPATAEEHHE